MKQEAWSDCIFKIYWFSLIVLMVHCLDILTPISYTDWGISDWMINYQGGFVRRGLDGQILYWLYQIHPFDLIIMVKRIVILSSLILCGIIISTFSKERWSMAILPFGCCLFFIAFRLWQRRDSMILVLVYLVFLAFKKYFEKKKVGWLLLFWCLSFFMLLSHEASFFFCYPIIMIYSLVLTRRKKGQSLLMYLWHIWAPFFPCFLAMALVCLFKGNQDTSSTIWYSWHQVFVQYPDPYIPTDQIESKIGAGVSALTWKTLWTMKYHFSLNFFSYPVGPFSIKKLLVAPMLIWMLVATFILVTRINTINISFYSLAKEDQTQRISTILLVQFIFMLPLFTVLSCDWGRTTPYWIFSSLFALHIFGDLRIPIVTRWSNCIQNGISRIIPHTSLAYLMVAVFIPFVNFYGPHLGQVLPLRLIKAIIMRL